MKYFTKIKYNVTKVTKVGGWVYLLVTKVIKVGLEYDCRTLTLITLVTGITPGTPTLATLVTLVPRSLDLIR